MDQNKTFLIFFFYTFYCLYENLILLNALTMYGHNQVSQLFMTFGLVKLKTTIHIGI